VSGSTDGPGAPVPAPRFDPARRRRITFALILVTSLSSFESTIVSTAMPTIIGDLNGLPLYSWVFSIFLLASTVTMPLYGRLADVYGRRRILLTAILVFLSGAIGCAAARSMPQLIVGRALQGLGAGGLIPIAITVSADLYSLKERVKIQALFSSIWGLASLLGPLLGAALTVHFGWRSIFTVTLPLGGLAFLLVVTQMVESRAATRDPIDLAGAGALTAAVSMLLFGILHRTGGLPPALRATLLGGAAVAAALFVVRQRTAAHPLVPPALFRRVETAFPYLGGALLGTTIYGVDTFVPLFVQGARGGTAGQAGAVVTPVVFGWALSSALAARTILKFGFRPAARVGALLIVAGFGSLILAARHDGGVPWISVSCALIGLGLGPASISQVLAIQDAADERIRGIATSLVPFFRTIGGSIGVGALGGILAAGLDRRLGAGAAMAGHLLSGRVPSIEGVTPQALRHAIEGSLVPVFAVLLGLAVLHLLATSGFPERARSRTLPGSPPAH